jgi:hypothetical protein
MKEEKIEWNSDNVGPQPTIFETATTSPRLLHGFLTDSRTTIQGTEFRADRD